MFNLWTSLTVKGAGHSGRVGTEELSGISLGAFVLHVSINTLQSKPEPVSELHTPMCLLPESIFKAVTQ